MTVRQPTKMPKQQPLTTLNFSKTFHKEWNDPYFGELFNVGIYHLFNGREQMGYFLVAGEGAYFVSDGICYYTERTKKNPFGDAYAIKRFDTEEEVGTFRNYGFYSGAQSYGSVAFSGEEFISSMGVPDMKFSLFRRSTWRHYKVLLYKKNVIWTVYDFQDGASPGTFSPVCTDAVLNGKVQPGTSNLRTVLSGFYFIERMLTIQGSPS